MSQGIAKCPPFCLAAFLSCIYDNSNIPLEHTPAPQASVYEGHPFIFVFWGIWGMFQGSVGIFLDLTVDLLLFANQHFHQFFEQDDSQTVIGRKKFHLSKSHMLHGTGIFSYNYPLLNEHSHGKSPSFLIPGKYHQKWAGFSTATC